MLPVAAAVAASLAVGFGLGWPLGVIAAAGCLLLPFAVVQALLRLFPPRITRPPEREPAREPIRVTAIRITDPGHGLPRPSQPAITERNP